MEFLKGILLTIVNTILTGATTLFLFYIAGNFTDTNSSCGTGSLGYAVGGFILMVIIFIVLFIGYGYGIYTIFF